MGIMGGTEVSVAAAGTNEVVVGITACAGGGTVHTGVGDASVNLPHAELKKITINAPIRTWREILLIVQASTNQHSFRRSISMPVFGYGSPLSTLLN
jgi:hypothetical protein